MFDSGTLATHDVLIEPEVIAERQHIGVPPTGGQHHSATQVSEQPDRSTVLDADEPVGSREGVVDIDGRQSEGETPYCAKWHGAAKPTREGSP